MDAITPGFNIRQAASTPSRACRLSELERAIVEALVYSDIFDFPLTAEEIHRYLPRIALDLREVKDCLENGDFNGAPLAFAGDFYCLAGRESIWEIRKKRRRLALKMWPRALRYGSILSRLPFVRMVAVTGSLAPGNPRDVCDIDFLIVTSAGRLWRARILVKVFQLIDKSFANGILCPNYFVTEKLLKFRHENVYIARELAQMAPVHGLEIYNKIRSANAWSLDILPNSAGSPLATDCAASVNGPLKSVAEWMLDGRIGEGIENWECDRKIRRFHSKIEDFSEWTPYSREATGHKIGNGNRIMKRAQDRLSELGLD